MGPKHGPYGLLKGRIWYIVGTVYKDPTPQLEGLMPARGASQASSYWGLGSRVQGSLQYPESPSN